MRNIVPSCEFCTVWLLGSKQVCFGQPTLILYPENIGQFAFFEKVYRNDPSVVIATPKKVHGYN